MIAPTPEHQILSLDTRALPSEMAVQHICRAARPRLGEWVEFLIRPKAGMRHLSPLKFVEQGYRRRGLLFDQDVFERCMMSAMDLPEATHFSVNVHPSSLERDKFARFVLRSLDQWQVDPRRLVLELVEFGGPVDLMASRAAIEELRSHSISVALDDFGPGFSNLDLIAAGLVDFVKIDRSLVRFVDLHPGHLRLLHGLREFSRSTGTSLVAEGVENTTQFELLRDLDIEWIQGFQFSRPEIMAPARVRSEA